MPKHYAYTMKLDTGYAPYVDEKAGVCILTGCNSKVEKYPQQGSWVVGIGGKGTDYSGKLIHALEVKENLEYPRLKGTHPELYSTLPPEMTCRMKIKKVSNVLHSTNFYYFGDNAVTVPEGLKAIVYQGRGCKLVDQHNIDALVAFLQHEGYASPGVYGIPNDPPDEETRRKFGGCSSSEKADCG